MKERKVKLFIVTLVVMAIALFIGKVTGTEFYLGTIALYGCFILGNGAEHISKK